LPAPDRIPGRKRVLVVDDEETFRYVVRQILESEPDFELIEATDGAQGLLRVRQDRPDVVVLDLQMPVLDGFGMLKELIADPNTRDIPVIISTSLPTNAELEQRLPGATAMLTKSTLSKEILLGAIARALDSPANPQ
jgi:CheY-like chemotaxis protein